jgi:hypothetical protein
MVEGEDERSRIVLFHATGRFRPEPQPLDGMRAMARSKAAISIE